MDGHVVKRRATQTQVTYEVHDDMVLSPDGERLSSAAVAKLADRLHRIAAQQAQLEARRRYPIGAQILNSLSGRRYTVVGYGIPESPRPTVRARPVGPDTAGVVMLPVDDIEPAPPQAASRGRPAGGRGVPF